MKTSTEFRIIGHQLDDVLEELKCSLEPTVLKLRKNPKFDPKVHSYQHKWVLSDEDAELLKANNGAPGNGESQYQSGDEPKPILIWPQLRRLCILSGRVHGYANMEDQK